MIFNYPYLGYIVSSEERLQQWAIGNLLPENEPKVDMSEKPETRSYPKPFNINLLK